MNDQTQLGISKHDSPAQSYGQYMQMGPKCKPDSVFFQTFARKTAAFTSNSAVKSGYFAANVQIAKLPYGNNQFNVS